MLSLNLEEILDHLLKHKHNAKIQKETQQIVVVLKVENQEYPLFVRIAEDSDLLQLLTFIPRSFKPATVADLARLLHLFNKELDLPGFGMNEDSGHIFFRCTIPCSKRKLDGAILETYLNSIQTVCKTFSHAIHAVAEGAISFETLMKQAQEAAQKGSAK